MAPPIVFPDVRITGQLSVKADGISAQNRISILAQETNAVFPVPFHSLRVWDAFQTLLPGTAATDDLALVGGTFGTAPPVVTAGDVKAAGAVTRYARALVAVPECYDPGETLALALSAGMVTTVADVSCTIDVEVFKLDKVGGIGSDLCITTAQSINSLVFASKEFLVSPSGLEPGDVLDVRITVASNDAATATVTKPTVAGIDLLCDIRG